MRLGIDLGGTKIEIIALDGDGGPRLRRRIAAPQGDYANTVRAIADLVRAAEGELAIRGTVGVGIPGTVSPATGLVKNANSTWLIGHPLDRDLADALDRPVRLANDANCFALSEASDGAAAGAAVVFGVILGTGVGGGLVVGGRVIGGVNAIAGEWGHNPLPWADADDGPVQTCWCGKPGCIETYLSGRQLGREWQAAGGSGGAAELARRAVGGDPAAEFVLRRYERRLAKALASILNVVDPDVVVLGGGVSNITRLYDAVPREWARWTFSDEIATALVAPRHGDSSGVRGAAWLWSAAEARAFAEG